MANEVFTKHSLDGIRLWMAVQDQETDLVEYLTNARVRHHPVLAVDAGHLQVTPLSFQCQLGLLSVFKKMSQTSQRLGLVDEL